MSPKEILETKIALDVNDIMVICDLKKGRAYRVLKAAKQYQDRLNLNGKILTTDYLAYINRGC